ncbi:thiamine/thiamine pyrophosphate ABC transporter permease ThiP [Leucothrix pacifica]|uniref:Thiamine/thiamine pyrophosphate ABC transporter permease ThiP n=1 Tax=Leucothrix pacifica TaxID=1247513 RepID=A0A317CS98_9GAMM|nr:thiamine/thiamine pyrophosphate ABC transporter permease ThiP [Leucothrix pacifica]PWQ99192.1 thiamine/thiamine pyrophosphate ABC transporter permease ThiP [Leucothrix pacifica]
MTQLFGKFSLALLLSMTALAFYGLMGFSASKGNSGADWSLLHDSYFWSILGFSLKQAGLSAILSVVLAWPIARALYYSPWLPFRSGFLSLCLLCFIMPTLVLITGLVVLLGRSGLLVSGWVEGWNLYGLHGILIAHVFLNMPFAVRVLYQQMNNIPDTSWKLAGQLKFTPLQRLRWVEWASLKATFLRLFGFIAVLCFNSFAVVLALGGGPQATTLEVAVFQALKYDFNIPEALALAWIQFAITGLLYVMVSRWGSVNWLSAETSVRQWLPKPSALVSVFNAVLYTLVWCILLMPLLALIPGIAEMNWQKFNWQSVLLPTLTTLVVGVMSASIALVVAYGVLIPLRQSAIRGQHKLQLLHEWLGMHTLLAPAMVLSVGLYVYFLPRIDLDAWGMLFVVLLNAAVIVPFAAQHLRPRLLQFDQQYYRLADSLKLTGWARLKVELPWLKGTLLFSFSLVLLFAMGDVAIFSIFGDEDWMTLPWLIYRFAGTYRMAEASLASAILLLICAIIVLYFERSRRHAGN